MQEHSIVYEKIVRWLKNNALIAKFKKKVQQKLKQKYLLYIPPKIFVCTVSNYLGDAKSQHPRPARTTAGKRLHHVHS